MPHKSPKFKVYDTLSSFCAGEGIHPALAKRAKAENCPHVKPCGRFDSRAAEWIRKQSWDEVVILDKERLECERIEKQNRKLDFEHQVRLGILAGRCREAEVGTGHGSDHGGDAAIYDAGGL